jgi:uncharacterized protein YjiK
MVNLQVDKSQLTIIDTNRKQDAKAIVFKPDGHLLTNVSEASDIVGLNDGRFAVVADVSDKIRLVSADGTVEEIKLPGLPKNKPSEFEGVAVDSLNKWLFVSREESRELLRYRWDPAKKTAPVLDKTFALELHGKKGDANKGVEGLAFVPGHLSPTLMPLLLGVKEAKPRQLLHFDSNGNKKPKEVHFDKDDLEMAKLSHDFSAVTVDPLKGDLFVSSDESSSVTQLHLTAKNGELFATRVATSEVTDLDGRPLLRIEGLAFDKLGVLHVMSENNGMLLRFKRQ